LEAITDANARNGAASQTKEDIMSGMSEIRELTDHELDAVAGGVDGYVFCGDGLYSAGAGCPVPLGPAIQKGLNVIQDFLAQHK
jgi:hypothetical protein